MALITSQSLSPLSITRVKGGSACQIDIIMSYSLHCRWILKTNMWTEATIVLLMSTGNPLGNSVKFIEDVGFSKAVYKCQYVTKLTENIAIV